MPSVPMIPGGQGASGTSPAAGPSESNMLMALADLHQQGGLKDAPRSMPKGPPELPLGTKRGHAPSANRKLKVVK